MNIENCFLKLLSRIGPRASDQKAYRSHRKSITSRLKRNFRAHRIELIGSFKRETAIRDVSDIDLMIILNREEVKWGNSWKSSTRVLNHLREQLQDRYWNTVVGVDKQAVVIRFSDNKHPVDVVPAIYQGLSEKSRFPVYAIPDGLGFWMQTSPQAHNKYIIAENKRSKGRLKQTAQIIKYWCECRENSIPLNTFHLELLLAQERVCNGKTSLAACVHNALMLLHTRKCRPLTDPVGISAYIKAANSEAKLVRLRQAVDSWTDRTYKACQAERNGNVKEAYRLWDLVFNKTLPSFV
jgi:predicted nucleotidyltransferase